MTSEEPTLTGPSFLSTLSPEDNSSKTGKYFDYVIQSIIY